MLAYVVSPETTVITRVSGLPEELRRGPASAAGGHVCVEVGVGGDGGVGGVHVDVAVVFVEASIHFVYTLHKWSRQWSKSSACAKSHVCLHFIAACIAAWCNFNTSKYSSSVLISALFTR